MELRFETKMANAPFEFEPFTLGIRQHGGEETRRLRARVLAGDLLTEASF